MISSIPNTDNMQADLDVAITGTITPVQSGPGGNGNK